MSNSSVTSLYIYNCDGDCISALLFAFTFLIWLCCLCGLSIKRSMRTKIIRMTSLDNNEEGSLIVNNDFVVVDENIEKPPEYVE